MLRLVVVISVLAFVACSEEEHLSRKRRFSPFGYGFPFGGAYAGPGGAYAGPGGAYAGAAAGAGPWGSWSPWFQPRSYFPFNWAPFPPFVPFPQNWYEGENVCKEVKTRDDDAPDEFNEFMKNDDAPNVYSDFSNQQEICKGNNNKYWCLKKITDGSGKSKLQTTVYECCHGFVRGNPNGAPGCIESNPSPKPGVPQGPAKENDKYYYGVAPNEKYASKSFSSSSSSGGVVNSVGKVPAQ